VEATGLVAIFPTAPGVSREIGGNTFYDADFYDADEFVGLYFFSNQDEKRHSAPAVLHRCGCIQEERKDIQGGNTRMTTEIDRVGEHHE
jgi:hypothetical protein